MKYIPPARPVLISQIKRLIEEEHYSTVDRAANVADLFYRILPPEKHYKHSFDDLDMDLLRKLWGEIIRSEKNDVHLSALGASYASRSRITQLRFHGLVAKVRRDNGNQNPGHWLITRRGGQFLRGEIAIAKQVETVDNEVVGHGHETVHARDFKILDDFGPHYQSFYVDAENVLRQERLL